MSKMEGTTQQEEFLDTCILAYLLYYSFASTAWEDGEEDMLKRLASDYYGRECNTATPFYSILRKRHREQLVAAGLPDLENFNSIISPS